MKFAGGMCMFNSIHVTDNFEKQSSEVKLVASSPDVNPSNQSQKLLFEFNNQQLQFKIGEFIKLKSFISLEEKSVFVPNSALSEINGKPVVIVKNNPEQYAFRYISPGEDNGTHTIIVKGLDEKERYVIAGTYQVKMMIMNQ